jgi:hypothetical protein
MIPVTLLTRSDWTAKLAGAIAPLSGFALWARGDLLVIVLLVLGAVLLTRLAN